MENKIRSVFASDFHLGSPFSRTSELLEFLKWVSEQKPQYLFLAGDIIDFLHLKRSWHWTDDCNAIIQKILKISRHGTNVIYLAGNHDNVWRSFKELNFGNICITDEYIHTMANGKKILILHGDKWDNILIQSKFVYQIGDIGYSILLYLNKWFNFIRYKMGRKYWAISYEIKKNIKNIINFISNFENTLVHYAKEKNANAVLCGHLHYTEIKKIKDIDYYNTGCWVENNSYILEYQDGTMELKYWHNS